MIRYTQGNLLGSHAEALVNTVNEVGVMGKGIALMFKDAFPANTRAYEHAAKQREIHVGRMFVTENKALVGPRWIVNFPTKKHWRQRSRLEWVRDGLRDLSHVVRERGIRSVALPPLGCGNGGLVWDDVRPLIEAFAEQVPEVEVIAYTPNGVYQGAAKQRGVERLTPARALVAELVRRYAVLGLDCTILEVQKLAWFLSREIDRRRLPDPLKLKFKANKFGPYDDRLRHLLNALDGSYLHADKRLADASPFDLIRFDDSQAAALASYLDSGEVGPYRPALEAAATLIDGFESPLGMELLATVDWVLTRQHVEPHPQDVMSALAHWPGGAAAAARKRKLFDTELLRIALERLVSMDEPHDKTIAQGFVG